MAAARRPAPNPRGHVWGEGRPVKCTEVQVESALRKNKGQIYLTAQKMGISYSTLRTYMSRWPNLRKVVKEAKGLLIDKVEGKAELVVSRIGTWKERSGDQGMVKFILATKGKDRGYSERREIRHGGDAKAPPIKTEQSVRFVDELDLPFDINRAILEAARAKGISNGKVLAPSPSAE